MRCYLLDSICKIASIRNRIDGRLVPFTILLISSPMCATILVTAGVQPQAGGTRGVLKVVEKQFFAVLPFYARMQKKTHNQGLIIKFSRPEMRCISLIF